LRDGLAKLLSDPVHSARWIRGEKTSQIRDAGNGVLINFYFAGDFPDDGKPDPVVYPDPADVAVEIDGLSCSLWID
jgi:spore coat protein U-like protein